MLSKLRPEIGCGGIYLYSGSRAGWQGVQSHLGVHELTWKIKTKKKKIGW